MPSSLGVLVAALVAALVAVPLLDLLWTAWHQDPPEGYEPTRLRPLTRPREDEP